MTVSQPYFSGNFWWASSSYLARLPFPPDDHFESETWIGGGGPDVADLLPGLPGAVYPP